MARPLRVHVPGAFYHVTLRGNHRQPIFFCEKDRDLLDRLVADSFSRFAARLHAYCWMPNHLHMLVQVSDVPLGRLMLRIASAYARTVQLRINTTGHLFERRYHAVMVDDDSYLLTLVRYIHLNPVDAGICKDPADYPWSSHLLYLGRRQTAWVVTGFVMSLFASRPEEAVRRYVEFMACHEFEQRDVGQPSLRSVQPSVLDDAALFASPSKAALPSRSSASLEDLVSECCRRFDVTLDLLASPGRSRTLAAARAWLAHKAYVGRVATISAVARSLNRTEGALRHAMRRHPLASFDG